MAYTRTWGELLNVASKLNKSLPWNQIDALICDLVSSTIWTKYPWKETLTNIPAGLIPLVDGQQDYSVPTNIYRLTQATMVRTDVTPNQFIELDVSGTSTVDLVSRSAYGVRSVSLQSGVGLLRLDGAVRIPTNSTWELQGEYQLNPDKVTKLTDGVWISDQYHTVPIAGLTYYAYKLADDNRAGGIQKAEYGRAAYSGQFAEFMAGIDEMAAQEDYGGEDTLFPEDTLAPGVSTGGLNIFPNG